MRKYLYGLDLKEIETACSLLTMAPYRAKQIYTWLYRSHVQNENQLYNISKEDRVRLLTAGYSFHLGHIEKEWASNLDRTVKYLIRTDEDTVSTPPPPAAATKIVNAGSSSDSDATDVAPTLRAGSSASKSVVESVLIPMDDGHRMTLCVSSQVGCSLSCSFCHSGTQKWSKNLTAREILAQYLLPTMKEKRDTEGELKDPLPKQHRYINNIVFMGQGEPLLNYRNVKRAIDLLTDHRGIRFGKRNITISTSGISPAIERVQQELPGIGLAISLHAPTNSLRSELMSINRTYPIETLFEALKTGTDRVTFEYVLLKDVNDSLAEAKELARLLKDFSLTRSHVNLMYVFTIICISCHVVHVVVVVPVTTCIMPLLLQTFADFWLDCLVLLTNGQALLMSLQIHIKALLSMIFCEKED